MRDGWHPKKLVVFFCLFLLAFIPLANIAASARSLQEINLAKLLNDNWNAYRDRFIQADGRVIDHRIGISTSEGQSYAMLRALWLRDKSTFDKTYDWALRNLQKRPAGDHLFGWKWGQLQTATSVDVPKNSPQWGLLDATAATDADQDIALALILAHKLWGDARYKNDALEILNDIWEKETIDSPLGRVVLPGDWKIDPKQVQLNPSYFAPYAYRVFADFDRDHRWDELVQSSYDILEKSCQLTQTHLPPDWVSFSSVDGSVALYSDPKDPRSDYGYEAIRVFWRLGVDALLIEEDKDAAARKKRSKPTDFAAAQALLNASDYLTRFWEIRGDMPATVSWHGIPRKDKIESGAIYGASLPFFFYQQSPQSQSVLRDVLVNRVVPNLEPGGQWNTTDDYYSQNWLWFGLASYAFMKKEVKYPKKLSPLGRLEWFMDLKSY
ncbi:MAG: glycosyl hydrolase family 8 [Vampirovibrionales bacterium]|nr:glycosyl hydrolase family 8 [Vampirovibrionales bacterium]